MTQFRSLRFSLITIFFCGSLMFSQTEINQFDEAGKRHGIWKKHYSDSTQLRYEGRFEHGKEVGTFKFYCEDCKDKPSAILHYNKRNNIADVQYLDKKGKVISEGQMENHERIGKWKYFHPNSEILMSEEHYSNGKLDGIIVTYYPNGKKTEEIEYSSGVQNGIHNYFSEEGILIKKLIYENGKLHGPAFYYDAQGQLTIEGFYKNGKKDKIWKYYENGRVVLEEKYPIKYERRSIPDE